MIEYLNGIDRQLYFFLNGLGHERWDEIWLFITNKWSSVFLYVLLVFLIFRKMGWKRTLVILVLVALMITITDQFSNFLKQTIARPRPCHLDEGERVLARCGAFGFPSAHAFSSMALAVFIGLLLKKQYTYILPFLILWSFSLGYSRIYVGVHYPGDVLTGWILGAVVGMLFFKLHRTLSSKEWLKRATDSGLL